MRGSLSPSPPPPGGASPLKREAQISPPAPTAYWNDKAAFDYDRKFTDTSLGRLLRRAVWRILSRRFHPGQKLLDLGCGTGEDALYFAGRGLPTLGIDASPDMIEVARSKAELRGLSPFPGGTVPVLSRGNVRFLNLAFENLGRLGNEPLFDAAYSNFGALNCSSDLAQVGSDLARLIKPRGYAAVTAMGKFCLLETAGFLLKGRFDQAGRRWNKGKKGDSPPSLGGQSPFHFPSYFSVNELAYAWKTHFKLVKTHSLGTLLPPTDFSGLVERRPGVFGLLGRLDRRIGSWPGLHYLSDHFVAVFQKC